MTRTRARSVAGGFVRHVRLVPNTDTGGTVVER
jgi:hypothetical protein